MTSDKANETQGVELAYEFDAPDKTTLESWFSERNLRPSEIHEVTANRPQAIVRNASF
jgi:hypothetical protein